MAKAMATATAIKRLAKTEGKHRVAPSLYLRVRGASVSWLFRASVQGRDRDVSLGPLDALTLAEAAARAADMRIRLKRGEVVFADPAAGGDDSFRAVAQAHIESKRGGWKSAKHAAQWSATLETYAYPTLGSKRVADISVDDVKAVLMQPVGPARVPLWTAKNETALRVRGRIEAALAVARVRGLRTGDNPAAYQNNLELILPQVSRRARVRHHPAMAWRDLPAFFPELRKRTGSSAWALQFTILTACRTGEVVGARWSEVDADAAVWVVPRERMKAKREHRVPLSSAALDLLRDLPQVNDCPLVFPGARLRKPRDGVAAGEVGPLSNMAMLELLRGMRPGLTVHGFRSSFRDWAAEATDAPAEVVEMCLAHTISNQVEAAYRRGDLLDKRRALMQQWADYLGDGE